MCVSGLPVASSKGGNTAKPNSAPPTTAAPVICEEKLEIACVCTVA